MFLSIVSQEESYDQKRDSLSSTSAEPAWSYAVVNGTRLKECSSKHSGKQDLLNSEGTDSGQHTEANSNSKKARYKTAEPTPQSISPDSISHPDFMNFSSIEVLDTDIPRLETTTVQSSQANELSTPGLMIPGGEPDERFKEAISQIFKLGQEAKEQVEKEKELEKKVTNLEKTLAEVRDELTTLKDELKRKNETLETLNHEIAKKDEEIEQHKEKNTELQQYTKELEKNYETKKAEKKKLEEELQQVRSELAKLESDHKKTKEKLAKLELDQKKDIEDLRKEIDRKIESECTRRLLEQLHKEEEGRQRAQRERDEERERAQRERDEERERAQKERDEERERVQKERDEERQRMKNERDEECQRIQKERDEERQRAEAQIKAMQQSLNALISKIPYLNIQNTKNKGT